MNRLTKILVGVGLVLLFVIAFGVRFSILKANLDAYDGEIPFTLESALQFRNVQMIYDGHGLSAHDPMIQYPEGIETFRTDTVLAEYVYAGLARVLPSSMPLDYRVRLLLIAWFSLSAPLMALWITGWTRSCSAGAVAGLFYAVALSAVIRSAGLEVSRENFAIPFLLAHLALDAWAARVSGGRRLYGRAIGSACCLAIALATWDMIQFYVLLWTLVLCVNAVRGAFDADAAPRFRWFAPAFALILVGVLSPYHRAHGLLLAPPLLLVYGVGLLTVLTRFGVLKRVTRYRARAGIIAAPLLVSLPFPALYGDSYGHFTQLLVAKIQFLNRKPADPFLLTFDQRIMWVPALDSASWGLTWVLFPAILALVLVVMVTALLAGLLRLKRSADSENGKLLQTIFFFGSSLITYVLFVRFHVYVAIFGVACVGWWWAWSVNRKGWAPCLVWPLVLIGLTIESARTLEDPGRWGRPNVYYREALELSDWLRENVAPAPVLANFGISASVLAYGECPIVLHPKFEMRAIRERVRSYGETLFKENEETFRDWVDEHGAKFYVYALGEFADRNPELQMRYFVNALEPPERAAARTFEYAPHETTYFEYVWGNRKYRVFRVISREDETQADALTILAERAFAQGDLNRAEEYAWAALALFPAQYRAQEVVRHAASLREQGFDYVPAPDDGAGNGRR